MFGQTDREKMYNRFKKVSKDITDHYKMPLDKKGYTDDDDKAVEELIVNMEEVNKVLEHYDSETPSTEESKSLRDFFKTIFGQGR
jgi:hypothetical protein